MRDSVERQDGDDAGKRDSAIGQPRRSAVSAGMEICAQAAPAALLRVAANQESLSVAFLNMISIS